MPSVNQVQPPLDTIAVDRSPVPCDGGAGPSSHPRVWLAIGDEGVAVCPYCSRRFLLKTASSPSAR